MTTFAQAKAHAKAHAKGKDPNGLNDAEPLTPEQLAEISARARKQQAAEPDPAAPDREHPPGLLGALVDHGARCCPFETRLPALAGAIVGLATASQNRFAVHLGGDNAIALNSYMGLVGDTAAGKDTALRHAVAIAEAGGVRPHAFASDPALHQALTAQPKDGADPRVQLVAMDEWGHALQQIKGGHAGHQRAMLTRLMEVRGLAVGGTLPARRYAKAKDDLPEVRNPFVNAIFATTPRTLRDALTSSDVVDGSLNRITILYLDPAPALRPLADIATGRLPPTLATLVARAARGRTVPEPGKKAPGAVLPETRMVDVQGERREIGGQDFTLITAEPEALAALDRFRADAVDHARADDKLGSLWGRAFENAVKIAGSCALGEAIGTDPDKDPGKPVITAATAAWAIALVERSIRETTGDLDRHLADHEAERIQKAIVRAAVKLRAVTLADPDPKVENTAPKDKQDEIRALKRDGWFPQRDLVRSVAGQGRSSRDVKAEINLLVEVEVLAQHSVEWTVRGGDPQERSFMTITSKH
jgi:hypothetical protein